MFGHAALALAALLQSPPRTCPIIMVETFALLFFDAGSAAISDDARSHLDDRVRLILDREYPMHVQLIGGADRVGSRGANRRLSYRRAIAVRDYLVSRGVPPSHIEVRAFGEDRTLVETSDGVPEPQNRVVQLFVAPDPREPPQVPACRTG